MKTELAEQLASIMPTALRGSIVRTTGMMAAAADFPAPVGAVAEIERQTGGPITAEVVGFRDDLTLLYLFNEMHGVRRGNQVRLVRTGRWLRVGPELLGRVIDANGDNQLTLDEVERAEQLAIDQLRRLRVPEPGNSIMNTTQQGQNPAGNRPAAAAPATAAPVAPGTPVQGTQSIPPRTQP